MVKKKKNHKLNKLSDEDRARFLQLKADMEEEFKRRKMKFIATFLKNKLIREEAFCRLNLSKINQEWRNILRQVKSNELHDDIVNVQEQCQHMLEHREKIIKNLLDDLEIADMMHEALFNTLMEIIEEFNNIQCQRIGFFHCNYENQKSFLSVSFAEEIRNFQMLARQMQQQIESVYYQLEEQAESNYQKNYERFLSKLDDIQASMNLKVEMICNRGQEKLELMSQIQKQLVYDYTTYMQAFYAEYKTLKDKDDEYTIQTKIYCESLEKSQRQITTLKIRTSETEENYQIEINQLKSLKDHLIQLFNQQKILQRHDINEQEFKFRVMTKASYQTINNLKSFNRKGETILQLAAACSRYETDKEKLRTLQNLSIMDQKSSCSKEDKNQDQDHEKAKDTTKKNKFYDWNLMRDFWKRVNYAESDIICLSQLKKSLELENHLLKNQLQQHLLDMNITNRSDRLFDEYLSKRPCSMRLEQIQHKAATRGLNGGPKCYSANTLKMPNSHFRNVIEANFTNAVRSYQTMNNKSKLPKIVSIKRNL